MPVFGVASGTSSTYPPFLINTIVRWGGSSIATETYGYLRQLYGTTAKIGGTAGYAGGTYGAHLLEVDLFGYPGADTNDSLGASDFCRPSTLPIVTHIDAMTNDIGGQTRTTALQRQFQELWRSTLAKLRCSGEYLSDNAAFAYSGTWASDTISYASVRSLNPGNGFWLGQKRKSTTTQNDTATLTVPAGVTTGWLILSGVATSSPTAGAAFSISGAGLASPITGTTAAMAKQSSLYAADTSALAIKLTGLTPGGSLVITKTDANGTKLGVEGFCVPSATPNTVIITKPYVTSGINPSVNALYNADLDGVIAEFVTSPYSQTNPAGDQSILVFDPMLAGFDYTTMAKDSLHPNDYGHRFLREKWEAFLGPVSKRGGIQR